jgi:hypothetical protein
MMHQIGFSRPKGIYNIKAHETNAREKVFGEVKMNSAVLAALPKQEHHLD